MASMPRVALVLDTRNWYVGAILHGVVDYLTTHGPWQTLIAGLGDITPEELTEGAVLDGVIAHPGFEDNGRTWAKAIEACKSPVVMLTDVFPHSAFPSVLPDDRAVGAMAAAYFLARGFRHFAYCGFNAPYSVNRFTGFKEALDDAGYEPSFYNSHYSEWGHYHFEWERGGIPDWLRSLPKPVAVMASTDIRARHLIYNCNRLGIKVPEEVALLSVDNETVVCEMMNPSLSSIPLDLRKVGYEGARMLDGIMAGEPAPSKPLLVPPLAPVTRRSSDIFAIEDSDVADAIRFIWEHAHEEITVESVLEAVPISRRSLEIRFKKIVGRSLQKEIWRVHVERAKKLLTDTLLPMPKVAKACGFLNADRLNAVFRRETGVAPVRYRRTHQGLK